MIIDATGSPRHKDSPRSPRSTPPIHDAYLSITGSLRPSSSRRALYRSGSTIPDSSPMMTRATSPGRMFITKKIALIANRNVGTAHNNLLRM